MIARRNLFGAATAFVVAGTANAQPKFPSEPVRLVVPRAPGGGTDILARLLQPGLEKRLGVPIIVDNRPDAAAVMGAAIVTKAKPDGHTLLATDNSFYQNPAILDSLPYDTLNGFTAITMLAQAPVLLIVHPDVPAKTLAELLDLAKKTNLTFASGGIGSSTHLMGVMVNLKAGTTITHVPFKSSGQALIALLGGHVTMQYGGLASAPPYIKDGKVRPIAITGEKRDATLPDVPTFTESGLSGADVSSVWGLHAAAGTPIEIRRALRDAVAEVMRNPETAKQLAERGYQTIASTPQEHQAQTEALVAQWIEVGKKVNLKE
ncbi:MAG: tripartite tricarboxylate transporter substrate binding protein [Alphaproteobacteria bacterium]|nr:tripartite tricarboxylate transporter substrate binding protein [Alphaproteobacteria bacterium]